MLFLITLESSRTLRLEWSECPKPIFAEIVRRIKTIPGATFDGEEKVWYVPVTALYTTLSLFPKATVAYDCFQAADAARSRAAAQLAALLARNGAELRFDASGAVCAVGECVSPLVAELVAARSDVLWAYVGALQPAISEPPAQGTVEVTDADRKFQPILTGIKAAYATEQAQQERGAKRRRKPKPTQERLI